MADVAHRFAYYDQMHMVHDFAEFTGASPSETLNQLETVYVEQIKSMRTEQSPLRQIAIYDLSSEVS